MDVTIGELERGTHHGAVVVIDVIRAFTTAAATFHAGAREIRCVESIEDALALRDQTPGSLLMGEDRGVPPAGFDLGNSPVQFDGVDLTDRIVVQRTTNGTRGLAWVDAPLVLAAAAVNASATAALAASMPPIRLICTGRSTSEDRTCAEHLLGLLRGDVPDTASTRQRILAADSEHRALWSRPRSAADIAAHDADLVACAEIDRYDFAMVADRRAGYVCLTRRDP
jgi:2-phosphosulfolactate phosphatase